MNKTELIAKVAETASISKKDAAAAVSATFDAITAALVADEKVSLIGFGTFEVRARSAREGHNPATGETIKIAASKSPAFKAGKALKDAVNAPKKGKKKK
ncbi:MAG: HU family DNA-binding protein [Clostridia bacterium]|nr:HU family DNA-binding protein [Clostridia bacterium]